MTRKFYPPHIIALRCSQQLIGCRQQIVGCFAEIVTLRKRFRQFTYCIGKNVDERVIRLHEKSVDRGNLVHVSNR